MHKIVLVGQRAGKHDRERSAGTVSLPEDNARIDIVNVLGQIVKTVETASTSETISLEGMERGMYFFSIKMQDKTITKKVIVE